MSDHFCFNETATTETKAQRAERLKRALNPWAAYAEIERFAREGFDAIPPEWLNTYFRWWGLYTQGDGAGAVGGKGGEGKAVRYFMQRIRIPNGLLTSAQLRAIAHLADECRRDDRAGTREGEQWMTPDPRTDPTGQRPLFAREGTEPPETAPSELGLDPDESSKETADGALMLNGREVARPRAITGDEDPEVGVEPVADTSHLQDHVLACPDEELDLDAPVRQPDRWQVGLAEGHPGDRQGIAGVALASPTGADPFVSRELWRDLPDRATGGDQEPRCRRPEARRSLDPDDRVRGGRLCPGK